MLELRGASALEVLHAAIGTWEDKSFSCDPQPVGPAVVSIRPKPFSLFLKHDYYQYYDYCYYCHCHHLESLLQPCTEPLTTSKDEMVKLCLSTKQVIASPGRLWFPSRQTKL